MKGSQGQHKKRLFAIVGASLVWGVLLCFWFLTHPAPNWPRILALSSSVRWWFAVFILAMFIVVWVFIWKAVLRRKLSKYRILLRLFSDGLLIAILLGALLWHLSERVLVFLAGALVISYVLRIAGSVISLSSGKRESRPGRD